MSSRHLIAYALIASILLSPILFLLARRWLHKRAIKAGNKPVHIKG